MPVYISTDYSQNKKRCVQLRGCSSWTRELYLSSLLVPNVDDMCLAWLLGQVRLLNKYNLKAKSSLIIQYIIKPLCVTLLDRARLSFNCGEEWKAAPEPQYTKMLLCKKLVKCSVPQDPFALSCNFFPLGSMSCKSLPPPFFFAAAAAAQRGILAP